MSRSTDRWAHRTWRRIRKQPIPQLTAQQKVKPIVGDWMWQEPLADDIVNAA